MPVSQLMPVEIEAKLKVDDLEPVRQKLRDVGAAPSGKVLETNTFLDTPDQALYHAGKGFRLRANRDASTSQSTHILTFKGPRQPGALKKREEIEVAVHDSDAALSLLQSLGYVIILSFEKRRETWKLGNCKIELDEVPHLGPFVEIEGPDDQSIIRAREQLNLNDRPTITEAYVGLLIEHLKSRGRSEREIRF